MRNTRKYKSLDQFRKAITRCVRCGSCSAVCPTFQQVRRESQSPRGRIALIEAVLAGRLVLSGLYLDRVSTCTGCMACETQCASGVPVTAIIQAAKEDALQERRPGVIQAVIAGALKRDNLMRSFSWLAPIALHFRNNAVFGKGIGDGCNPLRIQDFRLRDQELQARGPRKKVIFYAGCAIRYFQQDIERATVRILDRLGYEVILPMDLKCCGRPYLSLGNREMARSLATHNTEVLASYDAEAVITSCASCGLTFKQEYPKLLTPEGGHPVPVMDIHEFLVDKLQGAELHSLPVTITWHDPCHLGRGQGLAKQARKILKMLRGVTFVEMAQPDHCCGFGGVMRATHPGLSQAIGRAKALDIVQTRAMLVVTGCPGCRMQIADSLSREGAGMGVVHTVQLIEAALRNTQCGIRNAELETIGT